MTEMNSQVKSKKRVSDHGEVFTAEREVNAMLDLVKQETERIDSRFLEPACGDGNFLVEILRRKLKVVKGRYRKSPSEYEKYAVLAVTSMYGVDILQDNVDACRKRLFDIWNKEYKKNCKKDANDECREAVKFILKRNILCGDALTLKTSTDEPIIFSEWAFATGAMIKRRDFELSRMLEKHEDQLQVSMFMGEWEHDDETDVYIPKPIREFPLTHYRKIWNNENGE